MAREAEAGAMQPLVQLHLEPQGAGRGQERVVPGASAGSSALSAP